MASQDGRPVVILAVVVARWCGVSTLRFLGDPFIQYGDALAAPEATADDIAAAWRALAKKRLASFAWLRKVRADAHLQPLLSEFGSVIASDGAPFVDLQQPAAMPGARKLRRLRQRFANHGELTFDIQEGEAAKPLIARALELKREWMAARGLTNRVIGDSDWESVLDELTAPGGLAKIAAARLSSGGRAAAIEIGFVYRNRWYAFLGSLEPEFAKFSPGQIQTADTIEYCRAAGYDAYDFLGPIHPQKTALMSDQIALRDYGVALDIRGFTGLCAAHIIPWAKAGMLSVPPGLRRFIIRGNGTERVGSVSRSG
ncbi:GNAT family N-acetyltransferase [Variibacter gotjawalensis]|uniref:GNAT family N-acetyltransferase n=1 Tax=Variibacter gotjawalensis TaxID=1333996 RepID=UPI000BBB5C50|nr:GNAT family N-acetyltransferase [Variibacter gotjawalensis]NIK50032.1 CelD/BcsL family acetyltransferase involved in cellulose biosynthesis [Variibacter gotjawalensis]